MQVDVYLRPAMSGLAGAPGKAMLAPKAKEALDQGIRALKENRLPEAEKQLAAALRLASMGRHRCSRRGHCADTDGDSGAVRAIVN